MNPLFEIPKRIAKSVSTRCFFMVNGGQERAWCRMIESMGLSADSMIIAYMQGLFPLGQPGGEIHWQSPDVRALIPADDVHVSKRLKTYIRKEAFDVRFDTDFAAVVEHCAGRDETWINQRLIDVYQEMHEKGLANSVEAYQNDRLVGGGFGISIGNVFFLESMFCLVNQASKVAFVKLADRLVEDGFEWIDCQYLSEHWKRFGAKPVSRQELVSKVTRGVSAGSRFGKSATVAENDADQAAVKKSQYATAENVENLELLGIR